MLFNQGLSSDDGSAYVRLLKPKTVEENSEDEEILNPDKTIWGQVIERVIALQKVPLTKKMKMLILSLFQYKLQSLMGKSLKL